MDRTNLSLYYASLDYADSSVNGGSASILVDEFTFGDSLEQKVIAVEPNNGIPRVFVLHQNYPNPFNPVTTLSYEIPEAGDVRLVIYDILGREVISLVNSRQLVGSHSIQWNGRDRFGKMVSTGVYIYRLQAGEFVNTKKLLLLK